MNWTSPLQNGVITEQLREADFSGCRAHPSRAQRNNGGEKRQPSLQFGTSRSANENGVASSANPWR